MMSTVTFFFSLLVAFGQLIADLLDVGTRVCPKGQPHQLAVQCYQLLAISPNLKVKRITYCLPF